MRGGGAFQLCPIQQTTRNRWLAHGCCDSLDHGQAAWRINTHSNSRAELARQSSPKNVGGGDGGRWYLKRQATAVLFRTKRPTWATLGTRITLLISVIGILVPNLICAYYGAHNKLDVRVDKGCGNSSCAVLYDCCRSACRFYGPRTYRPTSV